MIVLNGSIVCFCLFICFVYILLIDISHMHSFGIFVLLAHLKVWLVPKSKLSGIVALLSVDVDIARLCNVCIHFSA